MNNRDINELLTQLSPFYPQLQLPENRDDWDAGHSCLDYLSKELPLETLLLPSYLWLIQDQIDMCMRPRLSFPQLSVIREGAMRGDSILRGLRRAKAEVTVDLLKKYKVANCTELSTVAYQRMQEYIRNVYPVQGRFIDKEKGAHIMHQFLLFSLDDTQDISFEKMVENFCSPNTRILDVWAQKCEVATEMANLFCRSFTLLREGECEPISQGVEFIIKRSNGLENFLVGVVNSENQLVFRGQANVLLRNKSLFDRYIGDLNSHTRVSK